MKIILNIAYYYNNFNKKIYLNNVFNLEIVKINKNI